MATSAQSGVVRDNRRAAQWTIWLAWAQAALAGGVAVWTWFGARAAAPPAYPDKLVPADPASSAGAADLGLVLDGLQLLLFVAGVLVAARWLYVANGNARAMGATDMMVGPAWSIGWYFVPFANLFMPFVAMRELWRASAHPRDWQAASSPATLIGWWLFWLASNVAGSVAFRLQWEGDPSMFDAIPTAGAVSDALFVPAALLFAAIVGGIQKMQEGTGPAQLFR